MKSTWIEKCFESKRRVSETEYLLFDEDEASSSQKSQKRKNSDDEFDTQSKTNKKPKKKEGTPFIAAMFIL